MARLQLPMVPHAAVGSPVPQGARGAAHARTRDAYRDVPILQAPTWGHEVAAYFFFGGISAGSAVIGSLAALVPGRDLRVLARTAHYVSLAALLPCPPLLIDDLGRPERFHHMLRIFKPSSPMNLRAWALTAHGGMATLTVGRMLAAEGKVPAIGPLVKLMPEQALAAAALPSALALGGYTGVLLGTTSVPVWYTSPLLGALFMASSLSTGAAAVTLALAATDRETGRTHAALATAELVMGLTELSVLGGYVATSGSAARPLQQGRNGVLMGMAVGCLALATVVQAADHAASKRRRVLSLVSAGATIVGGACLRWAVVQAGRASALDREGTLQAMSPGRDAPGWGPPSASP
ncbi:MAG: polysulfide reductase NrfD [Chloroflexota bacterium]